MKRWRQTSRHLSETFNRVKRGGKPLGLIHISSMSRGYTAANTPRLSRDHRLKTTRGSREGTKKKNAKNATDGKHLPNALNDKILHNKDRFTVDD